jgi:hypothetical protein
MASCSSLVSGWTLMKFSLLNLIRKVWTLVSGMGYMDWGIVLVGDGGGLWIAHWGGRWRVTRKWSELRCNCMLVRHTLVH